VDIANRAVSYALVVALVARLRRLYKREQAVARIDHLTGVSNRLASYEALELEIARCKRNSAPFCLAYVDCDNFKLVNDSLGHAEGDGLLRRIAQALVRTVRKTDTVGRIGGDEFVVIFPMLEYANAPAVIGKLQLAVTHETSKHHRLITFSIGAGVFPTPPLSADDAMAFADHLMYQIKTSSGNAALLAEFAGTQREPTKQLRLTNPHLRAVVDG
jgi:diguanylate cyclase (GGDEF)-like protein